MITLKKHPEIKILYQKIKDSIKHAPTKLSAKDNQFKFLVTTPKNCPNPYINEGFITRNQKSIKHADPPSLKKRKEIFQLTTKKDFVPITSKVQENH